MDPLLLPDEIKIIVIIIMIIIIIVIIIIIIIFIIIIIMMSRHNLSASKQVTLGKWMEKMRMGFTL